MWRWGIALLLSLLWLSEGLAWIPAGSTLLGRDVAGTPTLLCRRFSRHCGREGAGARGGEGARLRGAVRGFSMVLAAAAASTEWKTGKMKGHQQPMAAGQKDLSFFQDLEELGVLLGGSGKAKMVWETLRAGKSPFEDEGVTAKARELLSDSFLGFPSVSLESISSDSTTKLLIDLNDGLQVESVVIPNIGRQSAQGAVEARTTLCVSSQVGCNRACDFCATGKMGFIRQLTTHEILSQVFHGLRVVRERDLPRINNIVFMGMGEPLNNPLNVMRAVEMLTDDRCFGFARSKVTVSTVGPSPAAVRAGGNMPAMLAWSVHAADDDLRKKLVPTTAHTMVELRDAFKEVLTGRSKQMSTFMVAVTLIEGINDGVEQADQLVELLQPLVDSGIKGLVVDLIPYNDIGQGGFERAGRERVCAFQRRLRNAGLACFVRVTRGDDDKAACGQLATPTNKAAAPK